jgi:hypothetical protein
VTIEACTRSRIRLAVEPGNAAPAGKPPGRHGMKTLLIVTIVQNSTAGLSLGRVGRVRQVGGNTVGQASRLS